MKRKRPKDFKSVDSILGNDYRDKGGTERLRGDFTTPLSLLRLLPLAVITGALGAFIALGLVMLIGLITHGLYYQEIAFNLVSPKDHSLGWLSVLIPTLGGGLVGLMAKYGSDKIRGHGIPEAMETILVGGSKVEPKLTILKPISSAISIGTGGPFGAEGPIILTGGAFGSLLAQFLKLSAIERRILLVSGAVAGMSGIFGTPVASVLLGIELLIFEWKPRSMVPMGIASAVAILIRHGFVAQGWMEAAPLFNVTTDPMISSFGIMDMVLLGLMCGGLSWLLTKVVYGAEDLFKLLPIHWAWWPAIGGLIIGLGGMIEPRALGVGYDTIAAELAGELGVLTLLSIFLVKLIIWAAGLGSGTSGGILAPLLIIGAAAGGLLGHLLPGASPTDWALLGMAGTLAGVTRSPMTSIIFPIELTHSTELLLPLLVTTTIAHLISVLILKRSILTEKVARRGFHLTREYTVDPMDVLFVRDVMEKDILTVEYGDSIGESVRILKQFPQKRRQRLLPVIKEQQLIGVVPWQDLLEAGRIADNKEKKVEQIMVKQLITVFPDESLREVADQMSIFQLGVMPVVKRENPGELYGLVTQFNLLEARRMILHEEREREQVLSVSVRKLRAYRMMRLYLKYPSYFRRNDHHGKDKE